eukprot:GEZU01019452.1.p1 GENE.GEZU01019452.1~~GEZU01019452.1.p1  ORF type:complete len:699 (+),score=137.23 GEZU01019452.1:144-2099(+)
MFVFEIPGLDYTNLRFDPPSRTSNAPTEEMINSEDIEYTVSRLAQVSVEDATTGTNTTNTSMLPPFIFGQQQQPPKPSPSIFVFGEPASSAQLPQPQQQQPQPANNPISPPFIFGQQQQPKPAPPPVFVFGATTDAGNINSNNTVKPAPQPTPPTPPVFVFGSAANTAPSPNASKPKSRSQPSFVFGVGPIPSSFNSSTPPPKPTPQPFVFGANPSGPSPNVNNNAAGTGFTFQGPTPSPFGATVGNNNNTSTAANSQTWTSFSFSSSGPTFAQSPLPQFNFTEKNHTTRRIVHAKRVTTERKSTHKKEQQQEAPQPQQPVDQQLLRKAEELKNKGNEYYKQGSYALAINHYTQAIEIDKTNAAYYGNRAAAHLMMKNYKQVIEDSKKAVELDHSFVKGYLRLATASVQLGLLTEALLHYDKVLSIEPENRSALAERRILQGVLDKINQAKALMLNKNRQYKQAHALFEEIFQQYPGASSSSSGQFKQLKILSAEAAAIGLKQFEAAMALINGPLDAISDDEATYLQALVQFYKNGNATIAIKNLLQVCKADPDNEHVKAALKRIRLIDSKRNAGKEAFEQNKFQEAYDHYTVAIGIDEYADKINAVLYSNRAACNMKYAYSIFFYTAILSVVHTPLLPLTFSCTSSAQEI